MELAYINGPDHWAILNDKGQVIFTTEDYWTAQDKFDQLLSDE